MVSKRQFDEEIENIVEQLIRIYKPEKIILPQTHADPAESA